MSQESSIKSQEVRKALFSQQKQCQYCLMKQKFGFSDKKCLQHSLKPDKNQQQSENQEQQYLTAIQMTQMLEQVQEGLQHYWTNLRVLSQGSPTKIQSQLEPVLAMTKKVQQKINKFFYDDTTYISQAKTLPKKKKTIEYGNFQYDHLQQSCVYIENEAEDIKQWVLHCFNVLACRKVIQPPDGFLPLQNEQIQMRIFRQSMENKFISIGQQLDKNQIKIQQLLNKLIFYMQKSSQNVPSQTIQNDILFLEGNPEVQTTEFDVATNKKQLFGNQRKSNSLEDLLANTSILKQQQSDKIHPREDELQRILLAQASCIQSLLTLQV